MVLAYHPKVLREVVAYLVHRALKLLEEVLAPKRRADIHRVRGVEVKRLFVLKLRHLHIDARVYVAPEICREHFAVRRKLDARYRLVAVELASGTLGADGARKKSDLHPVPRLWLARHVFAVWTRPEIDAEHPHRRMRIAELVAPLRREADAAYDVEAAVLHVCDALVVVAIDVVNGPVRMADDGLEPHLKGPGPCAVGSNLKKVASTVCRDTHPPLRPRHPEKLLAQLVVSIDMLDVALAIRLGKLLKELGPVLADCEIDVARTNRDNLDDALGALAKRGVEEERVDLAVVQRLHRSGTRGDRNVCRRQLRVLKVLHAVVVRHLPLRNGRVADSHSRPLCYLS